MGNFDRPHNCEVSGSMTTKQEIAYVVTREGHGQVIPCAIFVHFTDGEETVAAYNQLYIDKGLEGLNSSSTPLRFMIDREDTGG